MVYDWCYSCSNGKTLGLPSLHQLHLGASEDGELTLVRKVQQQRTPKTVNNGTYESSLSKRPPIANLPDELLSDIFNIAVACEHWSSESYTCALALSTVCKSFHRIVQPLLFKNIQLSSSHSLVPACKPAICLHRTIKANPGLGTLCKSVRFHIPSLSIHPVPENYILGEELLSQLPNVTSFTLHAGFRHPPTWPFIKRALLQYMPRIKNITFNREFWDLHLAPVCEIIQMVQSLQSLHLHGFSESEDRIIWSLNSKELEHTSTITILAISDFGETPEALHNLLKLPKALEHFRFGKIHSNPVDWDLSLFQSLLHDHRTSLKSIEIGELGREMKTINLLNFPNLEILNLSRWVFNFSPEIASSTLLGPKLHTFVWDFTIIDQHSESWGDFGPEQRDWILKFAQLSIARKSALRKIEIVFTPDEWSGPSTREEFKESVVFPWDLMDQVRDTLRGTCVDLSYNKCLTKEEFLQRIESLEEEREVLERGVGDQDIAAVFRGLSAQCWH